ncbi:hypothetical protein Agub_g11712 [Astrephomene gubernaculifera]|uniref:Lipase n=1 Tax=Astrephomene gubernaculifera TaxID=47775 RepID=A0AAD3HR17_9CHLO|nr:hypothetical protein Agub_g11712 [Astrephomene gubernaculifera]
MAAIPKCTCFFIMLVALGINGFVILGRRGQPNSNANTQPEDPYRVMADLVLPHGYPLTEHFVVTTDGYILRLFRLGPKPSQHSSSSSASTPAITSSSPGQSQQSGEQPPHPHLLPGAAATADVCSRPVVFLQHPLMGSSVDYVVLGPGRSLGFMLVDAGYDVWLTNVRGNRFSRNHTRLDPDSPADVAAFWAFSWDQHVALDLPAAVERVAAHTGCQRMMFVGYSQGTTIGLAALATQPRVASRVAAAVLLAPVAFVTHMNSAPFRLMALVRVEKLFNWLGLHEYAAHVPWFADKAARFCTRCPRLCAAYLFLLCGANPRGGNLDPGVVPAIMHYLPSGTSVQNMAHWGQLVRSANRTRLSYYDYGTECGNETAAGALTTPAGRETRYTAQPLDACFRFRTHH